MSESSSSSLIIQGRWAWRILPFVFVISAVVLYSARKEIREAEWESRYHLQRNAPGWSLIHAFTGRTVGR